MSAGSPSAAPRRWTYSHVRTVVRDAIQGRGLRALSPLSGRDQRHFAGCQSSVSGGQPPGSAAARGGHCQPGRAGGAHGSGGGAGPEIGRASGRGRGGGEGGGGVSKRRGEVR